jgi:HD-like signal output (HDOD) protein
MDKSEKARAAIEGIVSLPPLPATAQAALDTFADEFVDADQIVAIVNEDPGICAKLIGLANSAYYGLAEPVDDIFDAVSRVIGVETVRSVVLAMAMQRALDRGRCKAFNAERFWRESLLTAQCAKKIASKDRELTDH